MVGKAVKGERRDIFEELGENESDTRRGGGKSSFGIESKSKVH
jgi:hypothetical protein